MSSLEDRWRQVERDLGAGRVVSGQRTVHVPADRQQRDQHQADLGQRGDHRRPVRGSIAWHERQGSARCGLHLLRRHVLTGRPVAACALRGRSSLSHFDTRSGSVETISSS